MPSGIALGNHDDRDGRGRRHCRAYAGRRRNSQHVRRSPDGLGRERRQAIELAVRTDGVEVEGLTASIAKLRQTREQRVDPRTPRVDRSAGEVDDPVSPRGTLRPAGQRQEGAGNENRAARSCCHSITSSAQNVPGNATPVALADPRDHGEIGSRSAKRTATLILST